MRPESGAKAPVQDASLPDSGARPAPGAADMQRTPGAAHAPPTAAVSTPGAGHHRHDSGSQHDTTGMTQRVSMTQARPNFNLSQSVLQVLLAHAPPPKGGGTPAARIGRHAAQTGALSSPHGFNAGAHPQPKRARFLRRLGLTRLRIRSPNGRAFFASWLQGGRASAAQTSALSSPPGLNAGAYPQPKRARFLRRLASTRARIRSPDRAQRCPDRAQRCPDRAQRCPDRAQRCPDRAQRCPDRAQRCPDRAQRCPDRAQQCPDRAQRCPDGAQRCPDGAQRCPDRAQCCPDAARFLRSLTRARIRCPYRVPRSPNGHESAARIGRAFLTDRRGRVPAAWIGRRTARKRRSGAAPLANPDIHDVPADALSESTPSTQLRCTSP
jgi:hypothetical protein